MDEPISTNPVRMPPKEKKEFYWIRVPWSREQFGSWSSQDFLLSEVVSRLHPVQSV